MRFCLHRLYRLFCLIPRVRFIWKKKVFLLLLWRDILLGGIRSDLLYLNDRVSTPNHSIISCLRCNDSAIDGVSWKKTVIIFSSQIWLDLWISVNRSVKWKIFEFSLIAIFIQFSFFSYKILYFFHSGVITVTYL